MTNDIERIVNKCIDDNYHIFLAFDVVDGNLTKEEYFKQVRKHRDTK